MPDHRWFVSEGGSTGTPADPESARAEIERTLKDPGHAYRIPSHPFHREAVERMTALHSIAYPEPK